MGMTVTGVVAYGYNLGCEEEDTLDTENLSWYDRETDDDFEGAIEKMLLRSVGYTEEWNPGSDSDFWNRQRAAEVEHGVRTVRTGTWDYCGYLLVVTFQRVTWTEVKVVDTTVPEGADDKLRKALAALPGLTPVNSEPAWLLGCFYG